MAALDAIPAIIRAAGDDAVRAYREFLDDPKWSPRTQSAYRQSIGRFLRWAAPRGLSLEAVTGADLSAYAAEIAAQSSPQAASVSLTGVRGLLRHLASSGVLANNPFPRDPRGGHGPQGGHVVPRSAAGLGGEEGHAWKARVIAAIDAHLATVAANIIRLKGEFQGLEFGRGLLLAREDAVRQAAGNGAGGMPEISDAR
jgi:hypothetical protein